jgi:hypothetical protein
VVGDMSPFWPLAPWIRGACNVALCRPTNTIFYQCRRLHQQRFQNTMLEQTKIRPRKRQNKRLRNTRLRDKTREQGKTRDDEKLTQNKRLRARQNIETIRTLDTNSKQNEDRIMDTDLAQHPKHPSGSRTILTRTQRSESGFRT